MTLPPVCFNSGLTFALPVTTSVQREPYLIRKPGSSLVESSGPPGRNLLETEADRQGSNSLWRLLERPHSPHGQLTPQTACRLTRSQRGASRSHFGAILRSSHSRERWCFLKSACELRRVRIRGKREGIGAGSFLLCFVVFCSFFCC